MGLQRHRAGVPAGTERVSPALGASGPQVRRAAAGAQDAAQIHGRSITLDRHGRRIVKPANAVQDASAALEPVDESVDTTDVDTLGADLGELRVAFNELQASHLDLLARHNQLLASLRQGGLLAGGGGQ